MYPIIISLIIVRVYTVLIYEWNVYFKLFFSLGKYLNFNNQSNTIIIPTLRAKQLIYDGRPITSLRSGVSLPQLIIFNNDFDKNDYDETVRYLRHGRISINKYIYIYIILSGIRRSTAAAAVVINNFTFAREVFLSV